MEFVVRWKMATILGFGKKFWLGETRLAAGQVSKVILHILIDENSYIRTWLLGWLNLELELIMAQGNFF